MLRTQPHHPKHIVQQSSSCLSPGYLYQETLENTPFNIDCAILLNFDHNLGISWEHLHNLHIDCVVCV